jgi:hypothetical protein
MTPNRTGLLMPHVATFGELFAKVERHSPVPTFQPADVRGTGAGPQGLRERPRGVCVPGHTRVGPECHVFTGRARWMLNVLPTSEVLGLVTDHLFTHGAPAMPFATYPADPGHVVVAILNPKSGDSRWLARVPVESIPRLDWSDV